MQVYKTKNNSTNMEQKSCSICSKKIRVPCKSECNSSTCNGGMACITCTRNHFNFYLPLWERNTPKCFKCHGGILNNQKPYTVLTNQFLEIDTLKDKEHSTCPDCNALCSNQKALQNHLFSKCPNSHVKCQHCKYNFWGKRSFIQGIHLETNHAYFACTHCKFKVYNCSVQEKEAHLKSHLRDFISRKRHYSESIHAAQIELEEIKSRFYEKERPSSKKPKNTSNENTEIAENHQTANENAKSHQTANENAEKISGESDNSDNDSIFSFLEVEA